MEQEKEKKNRALYDLASLSEKYTKRQATQHDCLPSFLGDRDKWIEIEYGEEKILGIGPNRAGAAKAGQ
jgi:hypothetical protein